MEHTYPRAHLASGAPGLQIRVSFSSSGEEGVTWGSADIGWTRPIDRFCSIMRFFLLVVGEPREEREIAFEVRI
jgi:hypothetical protein